MIGDNIRFYRKKNEQTQDFLAESCSVTRQTISKWETGKSEPDLAMLSKLAEVLEVSEENLIYGPTDSEKKNAGLKVKRVGDNTIHVSIDGATAVGCSLAVVLSYLKWHSIGWAILHGCLNWIYIIYYVIKY